MGASSQVPRILEDETHDYLDRVGSQGSGAIIQNQSEQSKQNGDESKSWYLRVGVKGGGCSGFNYTLDLTETKGDNDEGWEQHGVEVICDARATSTSTARPLTSRTS